MLFINSESQFSLFIIFYVNIIIHYTVSTTGWRRNIKWMQNALTIYLLSESLFLSKTLLSKETERNWAIKKSIAMTVRRGTWTFALLPRCRLFVLCGDAVNKIPSCGAAVFLILNLRYSVKRKNLQTLCGVVVYHMAVVTKTADPGLLIDELNPIQAMGLLRSPSL